MRVLVVLGDGGLAPQLDTTVAALRRNGHEVEVLTAGGTGGRRRLATTLDYAVHMRDQHPAHDGAARIEADVPLPLRAPLRTRVGRNLVTRENGWDLLRGAYARMPAGRGVRAQVRDAAPDVVVSYPSFEARAPEVGVARAAHRVGLATVAVVGEGGALTAQGTLPFVPDAVAVWNHEMGREAERVHQLPPERILVTGAVALDGVFEQQPAATREELAARLHLDPGRPYVLVIEPVGEGLADAMGAATETQVVAREPGNGDLDVLAHSAMVLSSDPVALLDAAVADKPCVVVSATGLSGRAPRGHLRHVLEARMFEEVPNAQAAAEAVERVMRGEDPHQDFRRQFVRNFVRPHGWWTPAGDILAAAIAATAEGRRRGVSPGEVMGANPEAVTKNEALRDASDLPVERERERLAELRREHAVAVAGPVLAVWGDAAEAGRVCALLDSHPECHVRPPLGLAGGWEAADPVRGDGWREALAADAAQAAAPHGAPLLISPGLYRALMDDLVQRHPPATLPAALDRHLDAYLNAWLDYQSLNDGPRRFIVVSASDVLETLAARDHFLAACPGARLLDAREIDGDGDGDGDAAAGQLVAALEIAPHPSLSTPSFNGVPLAVAEAP